MNAEIELCVSDSSVDLCIESPIVVESTPVPAYQGATSVTPSQETQTLETQGFRLLENITINPIPSNYGLITWNGSTLTVS